MEQVAFVEFRLNSLELEVCEQLDVVLSMVVAMVAVVVPQLLISIQNEISNKSRHFKLTSLTVENKKKKTLEDNPRKFH